jgi:NADPH:quinone reductase-like Zn-dependent oxidoreductase
MKAMVITDFGGPEVFAARDMPTPAPGPNEVLVKVYATSVNPIDFKIRRSGSGSGRVPPIILGYDVSGVVVDVGEAVQRFVVGDEVYYTPETTVGQGSYAEYHVADKGIVAHKPPSLSHHQAASIPLAGCTAWDALIERAKLRVAEVVLIHGIGGVGSLAIQIAKACGAFVFASGSDYMLDLAEELGADRVFDHKTQDFGQIILEETQGAGVDVVMDTVGGQILAESVEVVKPFGRMVGIVRTAASLRAAFAKNITAHLVYMQRARYKLDALRALIEWGRLRPVVDSVLPLDDVAMAHQRLEAGGVKGKIVLHVGS